MSDHLSIAKLQLFHRLYEQANSASERAILFYGKEAERVGLTWSNRTWFHGDVTRVDWDGIVIKWDEYRRNCHVAGGHFDLPWDALADDTYKDYITSLVETQVAKQNSESATEKARELARKRAQLAQLKAELGET
jgi:hypothetical protein